jgi:RNA polymerase sigma factor (sigma-70 family)
MTSVAFDQFTGRLKRASCFEVTFQKRFERYPAHLANRTGKSMPLPDNNKNTWLSAQLYESIRRRVVRGFSGSRDEIEDAYHEALIAVFGSVNRCEQPETPLNLEAYLVSATKRKLIDAIRKNTSTVRKHDGFVADTTTSRTFDDTSPEVVAIGVERSACFQLLFDCLRGQLRSDVDEQLLRVFIQIQAELAQSLSDEHWIVLRARGLNDKGFATCAAMMQCSIGTAHNRWQEAIECIRGVFARHNLDAQAGTL